MEPTFEERRSPEEEFMWALRCSAAELLLRTADLGERLVDPDSLDGYDAARLSALAERLGDTAAYLRHMRTPLAPRARDLEQLKQSGQQLPIELAVWVHETLLANGQITEPQSTDDVSIVCNVLEAAIDECWEDQDAASDLGRFLAIAGQVVSQSQLPEPPDAA